MMEHQFSGILHENAKSGPNQALSGIGLPVAFGVEFTDHAQAFYP